MQRYARFALWVVLGVSVPVVLAIDPPPQPQRQKQAKPDEKRKAESAKQAANSKEGEDRINRRNTRMQERDREIDRMVNKPKK